jgi:hypothetical protein
MPLFPDIAKYGFDEIQFKSHLPGGFPIIGKYLSNKGKIITGNKICLIANYKRNNIPHSITLTFSKSDNECADINISIFTSSNYKNPDMFYKMKSIEFLNIIKYLLFLNKEHRPMGIAFNFMRVFTEPIFHDNPEKIAFLRGVKFAGPPSSPVDLVYLDQLKNNKVVMKMYAKPVFRFDRKLCNIHFFEHPLKLLVNLSDELFNGFRRET